MMRRLLLLLALGAAPAMGAAPGAPAASPQDLNARVTRLEQTIESQALVEMLTRIEALQREVQQLRGQLEEQTHTIEGLKRRQRELYLDVDRRLSNMERESSAVDPDAVPLTGVEGEAALEPSASAEERDAYQRAFDLLRDLRYDQAIAAFREFLKQYPDGRYGHIAQYWLGEANYAQRRFKQALIEYQRLLDAYPKSPKLAEAMLKIGHSHYEMGDKAAATRALNALIERYPNTTEAGQARNLLQQIKREG